MVANIFIALQNALFAFLLAMGAIVLIYFIYVVTKYEYQLKDLRRQVDGLAARLNSLEGNRK